MLKKLFVLIALLGPTSALATQNYECSLESKSSIFLQTKQNAATFWSLSGDDLFFPRSRFYQPDRTYTQLYGTLKNAARNDGREGSRHDLRDPDLFSYFVAGVTGATGATPQTNELLPSSQGKQKLVFSSFRLIPTTKGPE